MRLMIVDDSNIMRRAIEKYLEGYGLELVATAGDGEEALARFDACEPDLVTMDITMPRLNGLSCIEYMMKARPATRVLVISALNDPGTALRAYKLGARGFLPKPFTAEQLRREMASLGACRAGCVP